ALDLGDHVDSVALLCHLHGQPLEVTLGSLALKTAVQLFRHHHLDLAVGPWLHGDGTRRIADGEPWLRANAKLIRLALYQPHASCSLPLAAIHSHTTQ